MRFNPHPPLLAGETPRRRRLGHVDPVSIHTRHYWRVKRDHQRRIHHHDRFNPHPPLLAGETRLCPRPKRLRRCFNPHPPLLAGETPRLPASRLSCFGFNPHPPLLAGETGKHGSIGICVFVSIHTRHYWRVKRVMTPPSAGTMLFQSTPAITGG